MTDMENAIAKLDRYHHWVLSVRNKSGGRYAYTCSIRDGGHIYIAQARNIPEAIHRAIAKREMADKPKFKVIR